jgi:hypothetical protein
MLCEAIYAFLHPHRSHENFTKSTVELLNAFVAFMHQQENLVARLLRVLGAIALG